MDHVSGLLKKFPIFVVIGKKSVPVKRIVKLHLDRFYATFSKVGEHKLASVSISMLNVTNAPPYNRESRG